MFSNLVFFFLSVTNGLTPTHIAVNNYHMQIQYL